MLVFAITAERRDQLSLPRVVEVREAGVVELEVRAAEVAEPSHLLGICGGEVVPEAGMSGYTDASIAARPPR